jgi:hypothetical protein
MRIQERILGLRDAAPEFRRRDTREDSAFLEGAIAKFW